jgi:DNA-binding transcriptional regulator YhcF (GntR family)
VERNTLARQVKILKNAVKNVYSHLEVKTIIENLSSTFWKMATLLGRLMT